MPYPPERLSELCNEMDRVIALFEVQAKKIGYKPFIYFGVFMHNWTNECYDAIEDGIDILKEQNNNREMIIKHDWQLELLNTDFQRIFPDFQIVRKTTE